MRYRIHQPLHKVTLPNGLQPFAFGYRFTSHWTRRSSRTAYNTTSSVSIPTIRRADRHAPNAVRSYDRSIRRHRLTMQSFQSHRSRSAAYLPDCFIKLQRSAHPLPAVSEGIAVDALLTLHPLSPGVRGDSGDALLLLHPRDPFF